MICVKGAAVAESIDKNRLKTPIDRDSLQEQFRPCTWEEALDRIVNRIQTLIAQGEKESICLYGSGQFHTEDYYIAQKLVKGCLGVNNFDANSRLCMSWAVDRLSGQFRFRRSRLLLR
jgi:ferredoxin-nitrate reductase